MTETLHARTRSLLWVVAAAWVAACPATNDDGATKPQLKEPKEPEEPRAVIAVEATLSIKQRLPVRERLTGVVRAVGQVTIVPPVSGPITRVFVQSGDAVRAGDALVRIRAVTSSSRLAQSQAEVAVAEADEARLRAQVAALEASFARTRALAAEGLAGSEALETEKARLDAARAAAAQAAARIAQVRATVREREEAVDQFTVRAPIDGRVGQRTVEVGMQVDPGTPLFVIGRFDKMRVDVDVPQELLGKVQVGKPAEIVFDDGATPPLEATVSRLSPFLRAGSFSTTAEIDVEMPGERLMPGMFVNVDVLYGQTEPVVVVPRSALTEHSRRGVRGVYVATELRDVETSSSPEAARVLLPATPCTFVEVDIVEEGAHVAGVTGIDEGAWVVVVGQHLLMREDVRGPASARVRPVSFERVMWQQRLQREDLLRQHLEKQRRMTEERARPGAP